MSTNSSGADFGIGDRRWSAVDKFRGTMEAAGYKQVVPGLILLRLKYFPDAFLEKQAELEAGERAGPEERDECFARISRTSHAWRGEGQMDESQMLDAVIRRNPGAMGYGD